MGTYKIIVLSDGETWELARGAKLLEVSEEAYDKLLEDGYVRSLKHGTDILSEKEIK